MHAQSTSKTTGKFIIPPTNFGSWGILFSRCPSVRLSVRVSVRDTLVFSLISWKHSDGYSSISADTLISIRCTYITKSKGWGPILLELLPFVKFLNPVKSLCAHYHFNQWPEFDQTSTDTSLGQGKEVIRFWWPWPNFQGHYIIKTLKVSLVCTLISWIKRWNFTSLAQILQWDWGKKWLDFGDLDLIFKDTLALWNSNFDRKMLVCTLFLEPMARIWPN